jgi:hypothetical protein
MLSKTENGRDRLKRPLSGIPEYVIPEGTERVRKSANRWLDSVEKISRQLVLEIGENSQVKG